MIGVGYKCHCMHLNVKAKVSNCMKWKWKCMCRPRQKQAKTRKTMMVLQEWIPFEKVTWLVPGCLCFIFKQFFIVFTRLTYLISERGSKLCLWLDESERDSSYSQIREKKEKKNKKTTTTTILFMYLESNGCDKLGHLSQQITDYLNLWL